MKKVAKTRKETEEIAKVFLKKIMNTKKIHGARVVGLSGNLGAGKTAFVKAVAKHLSVKGVVNSPTFVIIKKYAVPHKDFKFLFHIDAYRLKNEKELRLLGWEEIIADPEHMVFIEWPENVKKALPKKTQYIRISHGPDEHRHFKI